MRAPTREQLVCLVGHAQTKTRLKIIERLSKVQVRAMLRKLGRPVRLFGDCDCDGDCDCYRDGDWGGRSNSRLRLRAIANAEADTSREERELVAALLAQALAEEVP